MDHYYPFVGDGRQKIQPISPLPCTVGLPVTRSVARMLIDRFNQKGVSVHSGQGGTLWVLITWCQLHNEGYVLKAQPGRVYMILKERID